jgi:hypothetical protein
MRSGGPRGEEANGCATVRYRRQFKFFEVLRIWQAGHRIPPRLDRIRNEAVFDVPRQ